MTPEERQRLIAMLLSERGGQGGGPVDAMEDPYTGGDKNKFGTPVPEMAPTEKPPPISGNNDSGGTGGFNPMNLKSLGGGGASVSPNAVGSAMSSPGMPAAASFPTGPGSMAGSSAAAELAAGTGAGQTVATPAAVSGTGGAAGGSGSMLAAAGPWAALAAAIAINEHEARDNPDRRRSGKGYWEDIVTGAAATKDAEYFGDKVGGPGGKIIEIGGKMLTPHGWVELAEKSLKPWDWF